MTLKTKRGTVTAPFGRNKGAGLRTALRRLAGAASLGLGLALAAPAGAEIAAGDAQIYRQAFAAAEAGRFAEARQIASRARQDLPAKVVRWLELSDSRTTATWRELSEFLDRNPEWPNLGAIRRNAEDRMPDLPTKEALAWFERFPALTMAGFTRHVDALMEARESERAIRMVRERYAQGTFGSVEERDFRRRFNSLLRPEDHWARLDRLLWDGDDAGAKRMMPLVDKGRQNLALARIALANATGGVDGALRRVPANLVDDPGLQFERLRWRRKRDMDAGAIEILAKPPKTLGRPDAWWQERHIIARRLIEKRNFKQAYQLVAGHGSRDGLAFAQAEFLAGWLALRYLERPADALKHFEMLYRGVTSPISRGRGAYWAGRAAAAMGDKARAKTWYESAISHGSTFYGLLAGDEMGLKAGSLVRPPAAPTDQAFADFNRRELVRLVRMLDRIEGREARLTTLFVRRLSTDAKTEAEYQLLGRLVGELGRAELGVQVSRQALQDGVLVFEAGFPIVEGKLPPRPEPGLVHAIVRQESNFSPTAVSSAGARGLMQLMPATAQHVARKLGLKHTHEKLTTDPAYNVRLGTTYLQDLIDRFDGSYVLAIASYNAGQGRVASWLKTYGDPRSAAIDTIDWIELIPIYETRNYVHRVLENLHIYRARLSATPVPLNQDLKRGGSGPG